MDAASNFAVTLISINTFKRKPAAVQCEEGFHYG